MMSGGIVVVLDVTAKSQELDRVAQTLRDIPEVSDLYEVTGEYDLVALIKTDSITSLRNLLKNKILSIEGISGTNTLVIIHTHKRLGKVVDE
jgi:DNA-binding Lrp family transcriptional regulator